MSWTCINPAQLLAVMDRDNPVSALETAAKAISGQLAQSWRDGKWWADERLYSGDGDRPFNLSPLLPDDFEITDPAAMFAEAERLLQAGDYERGWQLYEIRHQIPAGRAQMKRLFLPHWDGKTRPRRLLVHAEQGYGDCIMFARYLPLLDERGIVSDFAVAPEMGRLMRTLTYAGNVLIGFDENNYDYHIPLCSLPLALGVFEPLQCKPYLSPDYLRLSSGRCRVGICWAGRPAHPKNASRCLTLEQILEHVPPDAEVFSLQMGEYAQQLRYCDRPIADPTKLMGDWMATANIVAKLDMVVSVDTAIAHLASAMGIPTKLILKEPVEWRWPLSGSSTPWYESAELVRL